MTLIQRPEFARIIADELDFFFTYNKSKQEIPSAIQLDSVGKYVAVGTAQGSLFIYDIKKKDMVFAISSTSKEVSQIIWSPCSRYIMSIDSDSLLRLYDIAAALLSFKTVNAQPIVQIYKNKLEVQLPNNIKKILLVSFHYLASNSFSDFQVAVLTQDGAVFVVDSQKLASRVWLKLKVDDIFCYSNVIVLAHEQWLLSIQNEHLIGMFDLTTFKQSPMPSLSPGKKVQFCGGYRPKIIKGGRQFADFVAAFNETPSADVDSFELTLIYKDRLVVLDAMIQNTGSAIFIQDNSKALKALDLQQLVNTSQQLFLFLFPLPDYVSTIKDSNVLYAYCGKQSNMLGYFSPGGFCNTSIMENRFKFNEQTELQDFGEAKLSQISGSLEQLRIVESGKLMKMQRRFPVFAGILSGKTYIKHNQNSTEIFTGLNIRCGEVKNPIIIFRREEVQCLDFLFLGLRMVEENQLYQEREDEYDIVKDEVLYKEERRTVDEIALKNVRALNGIIETQIEDECYHVNRKPMVVSGMQEW